MSVYLRDDIKKFFTTPENAFNELMNLQGQTYRAQKGRLTQRIILGDKPYFLKIHTGVGFREIFKNLLQLRLPVLGAKNEWLAIQKLTELKIAVPNIAAFGLKGKNPAAVRSFILLDELTGTISLEDLCKNWRANPPSFALKKQLIEEVARITQVLHSNYINHRDLYICHFLLRQPFTNDQALKLFLIDLHRAQLRTGRKERWLIKDLAGLYFSSMDIGLTKRDWFRFMKRYAQKKLRTILTIDNHFWHKVKLRGEQLYRDHSNT